MQPEKKSYAYFQELERLTKAGLVAYLVLLTFGIIITTIGVDKAFNFFIHMKLCEVLFLILASINLLQILTRGVNKIQWLGEAHIWLDQKFFGFLFKSNDIILRELLMILEPKERAMIYTLVQQERTAIAQSVFSNLAEDRSIFERLLKRGIFRSWIWYWIAIYGVFVFCLLSAISLSKSILIPTIYAKTFFTSIGLVAVFHIIMILFLGKNLIFTTKRIMQEIISLHHSEILTLLRSFTKKL